MNKQRRAEVTSIREDVEALKELMIEMEKRLEAACKEAREVYDNHITPDNFQTCYNLSEATYYLGTAIGDVETALGELREIEPAVDYSQQ